jgi:hypothetical protein
MMSTKRRLLGALALAALVAMVAVVGGCGSSAPAGAGSGSSGSTSGASGAGSVDAASGGGNAAATKREKAVKFAECVRAHGVPHFPDPDTAGSFNFGVDVSAAVFTSAVNACKALEPPGALSSKRSPKQQTAALKFAQCVRANGVPDFPDPVNGQPLINTYQIPSSNRPGGMTILNAATHKCGSLLGAAARAAGGQGG